MGKTFWEIILWAIGFFFVFALLRWMTGCEMHWFELVVQPILASLICHGLERTYKKKFGKKEQ